MRYTTALLAIFLCSSVHGEPLTVDRIFAAPDLSGPRLREPKFSPDGRYITFLQGKQTNQAQLDLWAFDTRTGATRQLVDSLAFVSGPERLSAEEEARRERQRTASLRGIVDYEFSSDGNKLLVPLSGDLYVYDLKARRDAVRRLTSSDSYETDARFSPRGRYVSFIRDQDIFVIDLASGEERAITTDGDGLVQNGVAEFVAQEEMGRSTGYWWSPDEARIAFARIDDTTVAEVERFEIDATGARMVKQRYPAAGKANTKIELKLIELASSRVVTVDLPAMDGYLARVNWFPDAKHAAVQWQTRDQKRLDLLKVDAATGTATTLLTETSSSWVELHDDLKFLKQQRAFVWASRRTGYKHLYLYDFEGKLIRPLTHGEWMVVGDGVESGVVGIDEPRGLVYFLANEASPLERHLYSTSLTTRAPASVTRISKEPGGHNVRLLPGGGYLDMWSSPQQPPSVSIRNLDGTLKRWVVRNALDASHPYHPYFADHMAEDYGSIKASDGQDLYYRLIKPARMLEGKRYPVIIDTYGGPHVQYVRNDWMGGSRATQGYFRQLLAQRGFVVFSIDNRGSGSRGVAFEAALHMRMGKVEIEDQIRGVEFLKTLPFVDGSRVGIMGWSYGGYMSLMALAQPNVFKAAVAGAPVVDWTLYDTHYTERYLGTPAANAAGYEASSVMPYVSKFGGRLLLVHGMADDNVLFTNSTMLMQTLQSQGKAFDLMTYPGGKHGLVRMPEMGKHYYQMVVEFFEREIGRE